MTITYYAYALLSPGVIGQLIVTRTITEPGVVASKSQQWTGVTYPDTVAGRRRANTELAQLNGAGQ